MLIKFVNIQITTKHLSENKRFTIEMKQNFNAIIIDIGTI